MRARLQSLVNPFLNGCSTLRQGLVESGIRRLAVAANDVTQPPGGAQFSWHDAGDAQSIERPAVYAVADKCNSNLFDMQVPGNEGLLENCQQ